MEYLIYVVFAAGLYNCIMSIISSTSNIASMIVFRIVPFIIGVLLLIYSVPGIFYV